MFGALVIDLRRELLCGRDGLLRYSIEFWKIQTRRQANEIARRLR